MKLPRTAFRRTRRVTAVAAFVVGAAASALGVTVPDLEAALPAPRGGVGGPPHAGD